MRSLEQQRPMIRATNTGATALIDHRGQVTQSLAPITRGILQGQVQGRTGRTPFAVWASDLGLWPLWVLVLAALVAAIRESHRRSWVRPEAPPDAI
jgi:apolipoprotein N-acyltransferase